MINQSEFMRRLSGLTDFTLSDLMNRANRLRDAKVIKRSGGRGLSAATIDAEDAAKITLAAMTRVSANECPDAIKGLPEGLVKAITEILDEPTKADMVKLLLLDPSNKHAVIVWKDGKESVFSGEDEEHSGIISGLRNGFFLDGIIFEILSCAIMSRPKANKARMEWAQKAIKIGSEKGEEAALKWIEENPFKGGE